MCVHCVTMCDCVGGGVGVGGCDLREREQLTVIFLK